MNLEDKKVTSANRYVILVQRFSPVDHAQLTWRTNATKMSVSANLFLGIIKLSHSIPRFFE